MRKILSLLFAVMIVQAAQSQTIINGRYYNNINAWYKYRGVKLDSNFTLPTIIPMYGTEAGSLYANTTDSSLYLLIGATWVKQRGTISGSGVAYTLINGATNLGSGSQVFKDTSSNKINLRSIVAGSGVTVTQNTNDITIAATGGSGISEVRLKDFSDSVLQRIFPNNSGQHVKFFAGVMRPVWNGSSNDWEWLRSTTNHGLLGLNPTITASGGSMNITFPGVDSVVCSAITVDDDFQQLGVILGASVSASDATLKGSYIQKSTFFFLMPDFTAGNSFTQAASNYTCVLDTTSMLVTLNFSDATNLYKFYPKPYAGNYYQTAGVSNILQRVTNGATNQIRFKYPIDALSGYVKPKYLCTNDDNFFVDYEYRETFGFNYTQYPTNAAIWVLFLLIDNP